MTVPHITPGQAIILDAIARKGPITVSDLAALLGVKANTLQSRVRLMRLNKRIYIAGYDTGHTGHPALWAFGQGCDAVRPNKLITPEQRRDKERERNRLRYAKNMEAERERNKVNRAKRRKVLGVIDRKETRKLAKIEAMRKAAILKNATMLPFSW